MSLDMIYNDLIIEHSRNTSNRGPLPEKTHVEHGHNLTVVTILNLN